MNKKQKSSYIWQYYSIPDLREKVARCDLCGQRQSFKTTVSNLRKHLERRHPTVNLPSTRPNKDCQLQLPVPATSPGEYSTNINFENRANIPSVNRDHSYFIQPNETINKPSASTSSDVQMQSAVQPSVSSALQDNDQISITSFLSQSKKMGATLKKKIDKDLMDLFVYDYQPFSIVEDRGLKKFVKALNPLYELPSRKAISYTMLPAEYEICLNVVRQELLSVETVSLTTDTWTSCNTESYIAVTAHFITKDFNLRSVLLECSALKSSHTSENLAVAIAHIISKFHLEEKVILLVSDNATNIVGAVTNILKLRHFGCFAHSINLILQDVLKCVQDLTDRVKTVVNHFKRSSNATEKLNSVQKNMELDPKKLIKEVATRWNSTYYMMERFLELKDAIKTTVALINKDLPVLTEVELKICSELVMSLKPFEEVSRNLGGDNYLTASQIIPIANSLMSVCNKLLQEQFESPTLSVVQHLVTGIKSRLNNIELSRTITLATLLDPRFKLAVFLDKNAADSIKNHCSELIASIWRKKYSRPPVVINEDENKQSEEEEAKFSVWKDLDKMISSKKPSGSKTSAAIVELNRYLEDDCINRREDPLQWWRQNQQLYPLLSEIVRQKFCVVATSVPCERLFSKAGNIISERRTRLSSKKS